MGRLAKYIIQDGGFISLPVDFRLISCWCDTTEDNKDIIYLHVHEPSWVDGEAVRVKPVWINLLPINFPHSLPLADGFIPWGPIFNGPIDKEILSIHNEWYDAAFSGVAQSPSPPPPPPLKAKITYYSPDGRELVITARPPQGRLWFKGEVLINNGILYNVLGIDQVAPEEYVVTLLNPAVTKAPE